MTPVPPTALAGERPAVVAKGCPPAPQSVGRVRRFLAEHLEAWGLAELADSAELVVSELVTNAVAHARPPYGNVIATRFERLAADVRIEVHDVSDRRPERREASEDDPTGVLDVAERFRGFAELLVHTVAPALTAARRDGAERVAATRPPG